MKGKAVARLSKEVKMLQDQSPPGVIDMHINEADMHNLLFAIAGPDDTSFAGGIYVLKIQLPKDYPYSPPDFIMLTPNGRFREGAKICTSFSAFHPETWSPAYTLSTLLLSFISFFTDENSPAQGMVHMSVADRKRLAKQSVAWGQDSKHRSILKIFDHLRPGLQTKFSLEGAVARLSSEKAAAGSAPAAIPARGAQCQENTSPAADVPQVRSAATVDFTAAPEKVRTARAPLPHAQVQSQMVDLTSPPPAHLHSVSGAVKRARVAGRAVEATGGSASMAGSEKAAKAAKVSADVVDLT